MKIHPMTRFSESYASFLIRYLQYLRYNFRPCISIQQALNLCNIKPCCSCSIFVSAHIVILLAIVASKMLGVFERSIGKPPQGLIVPSVERPDSIKTREDIAQYYLNWRTEADTTIYNFPNGNFMALAQKDEPPPQPRSVFVMDDIVCIFVGALDNNTELRKFYGLPKGATEAMIVFAAYTVLRDRSPYPVDQVVKEFKGKCSFMLFDSKHSIVFLARDRKGCVELHWGTAADGSLVCSDDPKIIIGVCGNCYTPFPPGCLFTGANGLMSYDHPFHMVKAIEHKDDNGKIRAVVFQVDLHARLLSIPCADSGENCASASTMNNDEVR